MVSIMHMCGWGGFLKVLAPLRLFLTGGVPSVILELVLLLPASQHNNDPQGICIKSKEVKCISRIRIYTS